MEWRQVADSLLTAFPRRELKRQEIIGKRAKYDEEKALVICFEKKTWREIDVWDIADIYDALLFIVPDAVPYLIPGILQDHSDRDLDPIWLDNIFSYLENPRSKYLSRLTDEQRAAIAGWLAYIAQMGRDDVDVSRAGEIAAAWKSAS